MEKQKNRSREGEIELNYQVSVHRPVGLMEMLYLTKARIEAENFGASDRTFANEIAFIIAEVLRLPEAAEVRIEGNRLPARMVQEVFALIERENVENVIASFRNAKYEIRHKKTYLRTALYNSVFEVESKIENEFSSGV